MPVINRQLPPRAAKPVSNGLPQIGDILDSGVPVESLVTSKVTWALYGRNGVGKTTLACQGKKPLALIAIDPAPTGGARSVMHIPGVKVYQVAARYLKDKDGNIEKVKGSEKMLAIVDSLKRRFVAGQKPFATVVIDSVTSWNDIILCEILGEDYENMPAILGWGKVNRDQYTERGEKLIRYLRPFFDLPCDVTILANERDHNPPKETDNKGRERVIQSKLMREAHPMAQAGSFFSLSVGDTQAKWIQDNCDFVTQLYEDDELVEVKSPDIPSPKGDGSVIAGNTVLAATGRRVRRLRCIYHPNYASRCRGNRLVIPEYIEAPTPEERYAAFADMVSGKKTKWGKYQE